MNKIWWVAGALALGVGMAEAQTAITHWDLQAVNSTGYTAWVESFPFTIQGVILNDPEEMLDPAYNPGAAGPSSGGQYQVFIQAVAAGDRGGGIPQHFGRLPHLFPRRGRNAMIPFERAAHGGLVHAGQPRDVVHPGEVSRNGSIGLRH